jgi:hypothetical protein
MHSIRIERNGDVPLEFSGEELGYATSESPGKHRWFEVTIYRTATDRYVVHGVGMSRLPGEDDRHWAVVCEGGHDVVAALYRVGDAGRYLPTTSAHALMDAAQRDGEIRDAYVLSV